jgi:phosphatidylserine/phosphatidylglycerophosphate/cardiolipin synthase-like enzyme
VIDQRELFVTSANFTEAAQNRNIEAGVLVSSSVLAVQAIDFFEEMVRQGICLRAA